VGARPRQHLPAGDHREGLGARPDEHPHPRALRRARDRLPRRAIIEEELSWGCSGIQTSIGCNNLAITPLLVAGSDELKQTYLGRLVDAPLLASFC